LTLKQLAIDPNLIVYLDYPEGLITSNDFEKYWITVEASRISFGKGEPGEIEILRWIMIMRVIFGVLTMNLGGKTEIQSKTFAL